MARQSISNAANNPSLNAEQVSAAKKLLLTIDLINQTVGDAISDMLLVETILLANGWDVRDWLGTYVDLANCLRKVKVADRNVVTTANAERQCVTPTGLQAAIDRVVVKYPRGRSFVRASGTEDVVRVYAEAFAKEVYTVYALYNSGLYIYSYFLSFKDAERLADEVQQLVFDMAGGVI